MKTNDILSKFMSNNSKLEAVLYKKNLSSDVKNLLLSMLYNITSSYNDYANIKVNVESKNKYVEGIIQIIKMCNSIEIVSPSSDEGKKWSEEGITSVVDSYAKTIRVFPTEKAMLFALFKLNDTKMYLDEKYNLLTIALPELLNEGRDINNIEIIRDFNAWSWNTLPSEISNIDCNLIYQNLQILVGFDFLDNWMKLEKQKELLEKLENELSSMYDKENVEYLLKLIYRISILVCVQRNKTEKTRLIDEKKWDEKELLRLKDKQKLVEELTQTKKKKAKEIKKIDKMLSNQKLLEAEFEKRNKKLSEYRKIYSVENLAGTLKKERKKAMNEIADCNKLLDAKEYVKRKEEIEKNLDLLKNINTPARVKGKYKIELQKVFIKCFDENIEKIDMQDGQKQLLDLLSIFRYYNFIVFDDEKFIKDVEELKQDIQLTEEKMLKKLYEVKSINYITKDTETDIKIVSPILKTRIMDLAQISIEAKGQGENIEIKVYDGKVLELSYTIKNEKSIEFKPKKTKLFPKYKEVRR